MASLRLSPFESRIGCRVHRFGRLRAAGCWAAGVLGCWAGRCGLGCGGGKRRLVWCELSLLLYFLRGCVGEAATGRRWRRRSVPKPTYGRLPRTGSFPFVHSLDHVGPFASSVAGLVASYDAMQGPDARDHGCSARAGERVAPGLGMARPLRVAVLGGWFHEWADGAARQAVADAARVLGATATVELRTAEIGSTTKVFT